jgi:hypothetical protein
MMARLGPIPNQTGKLQTIYCKNFSFLCKYFVKHALGHALERVCLSGILVSAPWSSHVVVSVLLTIHVDWTVGSHTAVVLMKTSSVESKATRKWQYFVETLV